MICFYDEKLQLFCWKGDFIRFRYLYAAYHKIQGYKACGKCLNAKTKRESKTWKRENRTWVENLDCLTTSSGHVTSSRFPLALTGPVGRGTPSVDIRRNTPRRAWIGISSETYAEMTKQTLYIIMWILFWFTNLYRWTFVLENTCSSADRTSVPWSLHLSWH